MDLLKKCPFLQTFPFGICLLGWSSHWVGRHQSRGLDFYSAHVHAAPITIRTVSLAFVALLEVLYAFNMVQIGKILITHLQTFLVSKVVRQDFTLR